MNGRTAAVRETAITESRDSRCPRWSEERSFRPREIQCQRLRLLADVRQQCHEASALDRGGDRVLANRRAARFAATDNASVAID
jgi:hypothetical protein